MRNRKQKAIYIAACIAIIMVMISSAFFIAEESHHECTGHDCYTCMLIRNTEETVRTIGYGFLLIAVAFLIHAFLQISIPQEDKKTQYYNTLFSQKVRLND